MPDLPSELWLKILSHVPEAMQRKDLMAVNRSFYEYFMERLYNTISFKRSSHGVLMNLNRISRLVTDPSCAKRVRRLSVDLFALGPFERALQGEQEYGINKKNFSRPFRLLKGIKARGRRSRKDLSTTNAYPAIEALVHGLSEIDHLEVNCEYATHDLANIILFFDSVWTTLAPTQVSLRLPPEMFGAVLHGSYQPRIITVESISFTFVMSFMYPDPELPPLPYASDADCISAIAKLIHLSGNSLTSLQFKDWHGFEEFPTLLSRIGHVEGLRSIEFATRVPRFLMRSSAHIEETTKAARAIASFLEVHTSHVKDVALDLVGGYTTMGDQVGAIEYLTPEIYKFNRSFYRRTGNLVPREEALRVLATTTGLLPCLVPMRLRRIIIKSPFLAESDLRLILGGQERHHLLHLEVIMVGALMRSMFQLFGSQLPNLEKLCVHGRLYDQVEFARKISAAPIPGWNPKSIFISVKQDSDSPYFPAYLPMMALALAVPSVRDFSPSGTSFEALLNNQEYNTLRIQLESLSPRNWLYSPRTQMPPLPPPSPPPPPVPLPAPYRCIMPSRPEGGANTYGAHFFARY